MHLNFASSHSYSCGYKNAYEEYATILRTKFPELTVVGENANPPFVKMKLAQMLSVGKFIIIALVLGNVNPFAMMNVATPSVWLWLTEHKAYGTLMTFFLANTLESNLISTGAFEITLNGEKLRSEKNIYCAMHFIPDVPVWSKIQTGRIPSPQELVQIIDNHNLMKADLNSYRLNTDRDFT